MPPYQRTSLPQLFGELAEGQRVLAEALELSEYNLLPTETLVMALLEELPQRSPTDLARLTGLSRGRITHLTSSLCEREYLVKRPDPRDGRRQLLSLTAEGKEAAVAALRCVDHLQASLVHELGAAGVDMLAQQLAALRRLQPQETEPEE